MLPSLPASLPEFFDQLRKTNGRKALFRFYDPRILSAIHDGLSADVLGKALFTPTSEWWLWQSGNYRNLLEGFRHG